MSEVMKNFTKAFGVIGSGFGAMTDLVDGIGSSIKEGKDAVLEEINASKYEAKLENAKAAILMKYRACKEISEKMGIPMEDAEKLIDKAMEDD